MTERTKENLIKIFQINARSTALHWKLLTFPQLVEKLSAFYGTRWFTVAFTSARHFSLS